MASNGQTYMKAPEVLGLDITTNTLDITNKPQITVTIPEYDTTSFDDDVISLFLNVPVTDAPDITLALDSKKRGTQPTTFFVASSLFNKGKQNTLWYSVTNKAGNTSESIVNTFNVVEAKNGGSIIFVDAKDGKLNETDVLAKGTQVRCFFTGLAALAKIKITLIVFQLDETSIEVESPAIALKPTDITNGYKDYSFHNDQYDLGNVSELAAIYTIVASGIIVEPAFVEFVEDNARPNVIALASQTIAIADLINHTGRQPYLPLTLYGKPYTSYDIRLTNGVFYDDPDSTSKILVSKDEGIVRTGVISSSGYMAIATITNDQAQIPYNVNLIFGNWGLLTAPNSDILCSYTYSTNAVADGLTPNLFFVNPIGDIKTVTISVTNSNIKITPIAGSASYNSATVTVDPNSKDYVWFSLTATHPTEAVVTVFIDGNPMELNPSLRGRIKFVPGPKRMSSTRYIRLDSK